MSKKERKPRIVAPTREEVREYGGQAGAPADETKTPGPSAEAPPQEPKAGAPPAEAPPQEPPPPAAEEAAELKDKLLRVRAELANVQRRAANEKAEAVRYALAGFVRDLLPVVDDFERTLQAAESGGDPGSIVVGARLVYENLLRVFKSHHLQRIEAEGQPFDPAGHEAVTLQPSAEHPPQTVLREIQKGYRLHDRLIRPAKVIVSTEPEKEEKEREDDRPSERAGADRG